MNRAGLFIAVLVLLLAPGCLHGPRIHTFAPANAPEGIHARVRLTGSAEPGLTGELLAVRDDGIIIRSVAPEIVFIPYSRIRDGRFEQKNSLRIGAGRAPQPDKREQLRLNSRFPQGLAGEVLSELLSLHGQAEIRVIE